MAANSKVAGVFRKRLVSQIKDHRDLLPALPASSSLRRVAQYSSSYDKNVEDQVRPAVVPDHVIEAKSDKYWGPHPKTGVFGPADPSAAPGVGGHRSAPAEADSVLELTAWFRPLEDVEKPAPHPHA